MKKVSRFGLMATTLALAPSTSMAFELSYQPWYSQVSGQVANQGREVSLRRELNLDEATSNGFAIAEGGWLRLSYTPLDYAEEGRVEESAQFGGSSYTADTRLFTDANLTDMAAQLIWRPFADDERDHGLGLGLTIKLLDGDIRVTDLDQQESGDGGAGPEVIPIAGPILFGPSDDDPTERKTFSEVFPMLTLRYRSSLFGFLEIAGEGSYISDDDNEVLELQLALEARGERVGFSAGWHEKRYDVSDGDFAMDARFKGVFARLSVYL